MFNSISTQQTCQAAHQTVDCTLPGYAGFVTSPDIAGVGVILAYKITALLTLIFSTLTIVVDILDLFLRPQEQKYRETLRGILDAVVVSFSDQQLITSFAILISVQHFVGCSISAYHYDIVCNLILMSLVTHLASLVVIKSYFSNKLLGPIRVILIFIVFSLAGVMFAERDNSRFPTGVPNAKDSNTTTAPPLLAAAACFTSENITITDQFGMVMKASEVPGRVTGLGEYVVLFVITFLGLMVAIAQSIVTSPSFSSPSSPERKDNRITARKWIFVFRLALLFGAWAIAILAYIKFTNLQKWLAQSPWPQDDGEGKWDFGQTMPCMLLLLTPLSFFEACADNWPSQSDEKGVKNDKDKSNSA